MLGTGSAKAPRNSMQAKLEPITTPMGDRPVAKQSDAQKPHSIWFWVGLFVVFVFWGWYQNRESIKTNLEAKNLKANLHNLLIITFAAVIGIVGGKILFTKLTGLTANIPILGRSMAYVAQLFSAA